MTMFAQNTGGFANVSSGGTSVTVSNASDFLDYVSRSGQYTINISGTINLSGMNNVSSNKTIKGGTIAGGGLNLSGVTNVVIKDVTFRDWDDDAINMQNETTHVWVDHCSFTNGYDGAVDIKRGSDYITVSWNHFFNHRKTCLLGHSDSNSSQDSGKLRVTYHHNYFDNTFSRHPRVRFSALCHVYNNYYVGNDYSVASTMGAKVLVEGNYFQDCKNTTLVGYGSSDAGDIVQRNNSFSNSGSPETTGSVSNPPYSYSMDSSSSIPSIVSSNAGPYGGGSPDTPGGGGSGTYYRIQNQGTGLFIDAMGRTADGDICGQYANTNHVNAQWELLDTDNGFFRIKNRGTGMYLDGYGKTGNGWNANLHSDTNHYNAQWEKIGTAEYIRLRNRATGMYLDGMGRTTDGSNLGQYAGTNHVNAHWRLLAVTSGKSVAASVDVVEETIKFYPNPVLNTLHVTVKETSTLSIFNIAGQLLLKKQLSDVNNAVNVSDFSKGIYIVQLESLSDFKQTKLIKK